MSRTVKPGVSLGPEERELGMSCDITRRDFLNTVALGSGLALLGAAAPGLGGAAQAAAAVATPDDAWTGYAGVGDYRVSNGNTREVVAAGHGVRDKEYERAVAGASSTGENYDVVIVGGGFAGVIAAYSILKQSDRRLRCLLLDNHPIIGGEAKRNEFQVRGHRLIGPQGSNGADVPQEGGWRGDMWRDLGLPTEFEFAQLPPGRKRMDVPLDHYEWLLWADNSENHGYYFDEPRPHWVRNPWGHQLEGTPWPAELRRDLMRWRDEPVPPFKGSQDELARWLDTMTYDQYLTQHRRLSGEVARFADPLLASGAGLGSDALSAYVAYYFDYPGFQGLSPIDPHEVLNTPGRKLSVASERKTIYSFPGGNDGLMRCLVKWLNPDVIAGSRAFADVHNGPIQFGAMDRPGDPCRMRAGATVVRVEFDRSGAQGPAVVTYAKAGSLASVKARTLIWAGASWSAKHVIQGLPEDYRSAMESFPRSPMLIANVALDNWRALYQMGYTCCSWRGGFGYSGNIRAPMHVGDYRPPFDPDEPTLFTFYVPFPERGLPIAEQGKAGRAKLLAASYREYELQIRRQLTKLFGPAGFDARRDVAGIVLNRWGHAYVNAGPGFFFGLNGRPAPSEVLRRPLGKLTFAHSELSGHQTYPAAGEEGVRAARQILAML
jgi:spermidine dehydrogenase